MEPFAHRAPSRRVNPGPFAAQRRRWPRLLWAPLCCAAALWALPPALPRAEAAGPPKAAALPTTVSPALARQARALVQAQLEAFAADDAHRAFSFATPSIRKVFEGPDQFLEMVRTNYPVVYRPSSVTFLKAAWVDGELTQGVQMTDETGAVWLAVYHLEKQRDKTWRIAGCDVFPSQGRMV